MVGWGCSIVPGILDPADWDKGADCKETLFLVCRLLAERREGAWAVFTEERRSGTTTTGIAPSDKILLRDLVLAVVATVEFELRLLWLGLELPLLL
jgi:hypothetical protein